MKKMMRITKITGLFLAVMLVLPFCIFAPPAEAAPVRDISNIRDVSPEHWFYDYVKRLYEDGIINGVSSTSYAPDGEVKVSEAAAMITRYLGLEHMAAQSKRYLTDRNIEGTEFWYSGYIQLLFDTGILDTAHVEKYGIKLSGSSGNGTGIPQEAAALIDSPFTRMDFVKLIARSFEIQRGRGRANTSLKRELGGYGYEFITGGGYDTVTLDRIGDMITDFENIPEEYRMFFQKCYYNGIIRGDQYGNALPHDNLKRSELAKIIATVMYFELRDNDIRQIPEACVITPDDYLYFPAGKPPVLKREKAVQIIREQAKNITTQVSAESIIITILQKNIIPAGYLFEAYIYRHENGVFHEIGQLNGANDNRVFFPKEDVYTIPKSGAASSGGYAGHLYLILRDMNQKGEIAGTVMLNIDAAGNLNDAPVYNLP